LISLLYKQYQTVGERLRALRTLLSITRKDFAKKHAIPLPTLRAAEYSEGPLSFKQLKKLLKAFEEEGIICSEEWLIEGSGNLPVLAKHFINQEVEAIESHTHSEKLHFNSILVEAALFQKHIPESLVVRVTDNLMVPLYEENDYVGGIKLPLPLESHFYNKPSIVRLPDETHLVRIIYPGAESLLFTLMCPAPFYKTNPRLLINTPVKAIYRIIWHRKES
jgi:transcriptional regulator with XRE-family HTH domain